jgi:mannitol-1-/sugar-/sorbitol-6-/2-deoxyglucose-6-phosphatase
MTAIDLKQFDAVVFDMDGVLIDSEPMWRQAEIEVFATVGIHLTQQDCIDTQGIRIDEVVAIHYNKAPWTTPDCPTVAHQVVHCVAKLIRAHGVPLQGAGAVLKYLQDSGVVLGLASSSSQFLIDTILSTLDFKDCFRLTQSAEHEPYGKPHPAVYLSCAGQLGVDPRRCLAIEDSINGVIAAKAAQMQVVAIPEPHLRGDRRFGIADYQMDSLVQLEQAFRAAS